MTDTTTTMQELARRWVHDHDEVALAEYCQREAARLDAEETMTEPSTAPTVFVPDMDAVDDATRHATNRFDIVCKAYAELERQMAEAGCVVVRRDDAQGAMAVLLGVANSDETNAASAHRIMMSLHAAIHPTSPTI